jgi:hypothetical protein
MAQTKKIEVIVAQKGRKEGQGGKDAAAPPKEDEASGRSDRGHWVICPHCGAIRFVERGATGSDRFWYICGNCGGNYCF